MRAAAFAALLPAAALAGVMDDAGGWSDEVLREMCRTYTGAAPLVWKTPEEIIEDERERIQREYREAREAFAERSSLGLGAGAREGGTDPNRQGAGRGDDPVDGGEPAKPPPAETPAPVTLPLSAMLLAAALGLLWRVRAGA